MNSLDNDKFTEAMDLSTEGLIPPPPIKCDGQLYTVEPGDTISNIARKFIHNHTFYKNSAYNPDI